MRAAQVCRPYERTGQFSVVTLIRPLRGHLLAGRGKACGRPHGAAPTKGPGNSRWPPSSAPLGGTFPLTRGRLAGGHTGLPLRRILRRERWIGQVRRGSGTAPALIFHLPRAQWPGRNLECHSDFTRRKFCEIQQVRVPRNGVRGQATMSTKCSSGAVPGGVLPTLPPRAK